MVAILEKLAGGDNEDCAGDWWVPWYKWWKSVEMAWTTDGGEN